MKQLPAILPFALIAMRVALGLSFLSAVADRFGLWGAPGAANVAWGTFAAFLGYTATLMPFVPSGVIPAFGWAATILEIVLGIGLLTGLWLRWVALISAGLLLGFALAMTFSLGAEPAFSYSVWTAAAAAFLLACLSPEPARK